MKLGACYYPEHWPEDMWADDARRMADAGLSRVRIGEFAWSRIEPEPGVFDWGWLDRAINTLHAAGLEIILGTPTATPPKWLADQMPDMFAVDVHGRSRGFGSRRHYCFSHLGYRAEAARITRAVAQRYGNHPAVVMWQTDNEYGCHDTTISYSDAARDAFRFWLAQRYGDIGSLNTAWGNVFWSMEYRGFDQIELPNLTVTEANPAHWLAFRRFSSDQVISFDKAQIDILRELSPNRDVMHNAMGFVTDYDHHDLGQQLDVVMWDSYPLGFLEMFPFSDADKAAYVRQGHPDIAAFHHDLYRGCAADGRWGVIEQQPGPVNWARHNPAPLPGMVRLWTLEAMAHGAELVSYFRWRQAPFAQEQMHAGLLRPDSQAAPGLDEAIQAASDIADLGEAGRPIKEVALIFSYDAEWITQTQPQGEGLSALWAAFSIYTALREAGLNVDIIPPRADLSGYAMVAVPCLPAVPDQLVSALKAFDGSVIIGPRSGSKTDELSIPAGLAPGKLKALFPATVTRSESLRPGTHHAGDGWSATRWLDHLETEAEAELVAEDGMVACWKSANVRYCAAWPEGALIAEIARRAATEAGLEPVTLPTGVRVRKTDTYIFAFNYGNETQQVTLRGIERLGSSALSAAGVAVFEAS
ncbi:beta-galactosidase [Altererythrobacter sp. RZ02]|uniref:Beta-galactosidase n=1 Tax=Pontixanthobacter rizhaonensis TaxID=2730337 RepID=A0A848QHR6_9SPHN|nr:beta-galactosidase [Pontixanthobacter rizhaonensis]NMW30534.1 beta-galactosidase [Pontixanthobacter rizhaonensis]